VEESFGGKTPYSIGMKDDSPFVFAGLWVVSLIKDTLSIELSIGRILAIAQRHARSDSLSLQSSFIASGDLVPLLCRTFSRLN
jgi:hypothetical protein